MVLLQRKLYFFKDPEGVQHFPGGGGLFQGGGGVQMLISIETHITFKLLNFIMGVLLFPGYITFIVC